MMTKKVYDLVELFKDSKRVGCKFVLKSFTQKNDIDYKEIFCLIFKNNSLKIILAMVTHYDLEFHKMNVKNIFQNGSFREKKYIWTNLKDLFPH